MVTVQALKERYETTSRDARQLEEKVATMVGVIERLNTSLEAANHGESTLKEKVDNLSKSLSVTSTSTQNLQEKIQQVNLF